MWTRSATQILDDRPDHVRRSPGQAFIAEQDPLVTGPVDLIDEVLPI